MEGGAAAYCTREPRLPYLKALVLRWRTNVASTGIAVRENRIAGYERQRNWLEEIRRERFAAPEVQGIPGNSSGLIVRRIRSVGFGENNRLVDVYAVDTGFLRELCELEKQAAIECGHWEQHDCRCDTVKFEPEFTSETGTSARDFAF